MFDNPLVLLGISLVCAGIPAFIWLYILFSKNSKSKFVIALVFGLGCLTAPLLLGIQFLSAKYFQFDLGNFIDTSVLTNNTKYIVLGFVLAGAMEEIIKHYAVSSVDKKTILIKTIGDAIRYSLAAALGFSFAENIVYLYQNWAQVSINEFIGMYIYRSVFTTCGHLIYSGIFGYYYGIGKFSIDITKQHQLAGESSKITAFIAKFFSIPLSHAYQQQMVLKGLFIAITIHSFLNFLLQFNVVFPVIISVVLGYVYLQYLLSRKAGHLILSTDISSKRKTSMAKNDEDVVIELLGLWFQEKKYVDVIHICERLLERDPDNNVVKLFKAQASDRMDDKDTYKTILNTILIREKDLSKNDQNIITKYIENKDQIIKSQTTARTTPSITETPEIKKEEDNKKTFTLQL
ncbi:MAG: PrsW family glutamic-type intramembrane protease [Candidatus Gracilibacteria bacterium]